jgi:hypothetical protein
MPDKITPEAALAAAELVKRFCSEYTNGTHTCDGCPLFHPGPGRGCLVEDPADWFLPVER